LAHLVCARGTTDAPQAAQIVLSLGVILLGGFAIPLHRLSLILCRPKVSKIECITQFKLGLSIALFRLGADVSQKLAVFLALLGGQLKNATGKQEKQKPFQPIRLHAPSLRRFKRVPSAE
jgi:hypothetical protein